MAPKADNVFETDEGFETVVEPYAETFPFENTGDTLTGIYESVKTIQQEVLDKPGEMRDVNIYTLIDQGGEKWSVWGSYNVDAAFEKINPGDVVRIIYDGTVKIDGGKREVKQFTIQRRPA